MKAIRVRWLKNHDSNLSPIKCSLVRDWDGMYRWRIAPDGEVLESVPGKYFVAGAMLAFEKEFGARAIKEEGETSGKS